MQPGAQTEEQRLEAQYQQLSTKIGQVELEYNHSGVVFYILIICNDANQGGDLELFQEAFWAGSDNTYIPKIHEVRRLREQIKTYLPDSNLIKAATLLEELDHLVDDLAESVVALQMHITALGRPSDKRSLLVLSTEEDRQAVRSHPSFREWVLKLPETEHGLTMGILEDANQAVNGALQIEEHLSG